MESVTTETLSKGTETHMQPQKEEQPLVTEEHKKMKVFVAVDENEDSFYALNWVLEKLFKHSSASPTPELEQDHLTLLHVLQSFPQYVFPGAPAMFPTTSVSSSVAKVQRENAQVLLSRALQICKERKIVAETLLLEGNPKEMICQATEERHVDLLVVGSRGLGTIKRAFLGSVSDYCAHHAKCPILIVKPPKESHK